MIWFRIYIHYLGEQVDDSDKEDFYFVNWVTICHLDRYFSLILQSI